MPKRPQIDLFVLDSLASDIESLDNVLRVLNSDTDVGWHREWGRHFVRDEIVQSIARLIQNDLVRVYLWDEVQRGLVESAPRVLPPADFDNVWFGLTERGRMIHTNWETGSAPDE
jgi:hypothetical protein